MSVRALCIVRLDCALMIEKRCRILSKEEVLIVIGNLDRGGAEVHLSHVMPELVKEGFNIKIFLLNSLGTLAPLVSAKGVTLIKPWAQGPCDPKALRLLKLLWNSLHLFFYLLFRRPAIVHFFLPRNYLIGGLLSVLAATRVRLMSRRSMNYYLNKFPPVVRRFEYWLHTKMHGILGNSRKVIAQLQEEEGVPAQKTQLIYNGITLHRTRTVDVRADLAIPQESVLLVMVANLIPYKGHADLIAALAGMKLDQRWDLLLVGNDTSALQADLQEQAAAGQIVDRVHFLGSREDVADILPACDIGLLTSHEEGFSNAVLEGMGSGLAMVVTDVGGNAEAVLHEQTGLVVSPHAPDEIRDAVARLIADEGVRQSYGLAAQKRFEENFRLEACVQAYADFYSGLLKGTA